MVLVGSETDIYTAYVIVTLNVISNYDRTCYKEVPMYWILYGTSMRLQHVIWVRYHKEIANHIARPDSYFSVTALGILDMQWGNVQEACMKTRIRLPPTILKKVYYRCKEECEGKFIGLNSFHGDYIFEIRLNSLFGKNIFKIVTSYL